MILAMSGDKKKGSGYPRPQKRCPHPPGTEKHILWHASQIEAGRLAPRAIKGTSSRHPSFNAKTSRRGLPRAPVRLQIPYWYGDQTVEWSTTDDDEEDEGDEEQHERVGRPRSPLARRVPVNGGAGAAPRPLPSVLLPDTKLPPNDAKPVNLLRVVIPKDAQSIVSPSTPLSSADGTPLAISITTTTPQTTDGTPSGTTPLVTTPSGTTSTETTPTGTTPTGTTPPLTARYIRSGSESLVSTPGLASANGLLREIEYDASTPRPFPVDHQRGQQDDLTARQDTLDNPTPAMRQIYGRTKLPPLNKFSFTPLAKNAAVSDKPISKSQQTQSKQIHDSINDVLGSIEREVVMFQVTMSPENLTDDLKHKIQIAKHSIILLKAKADNKLLSSEYGSSEDDKKAGFAALEKTKQETEEFIKKEWTPLKTTLLNPQSTQITTGAQPKVIHLDVWDGVDKQAIEAAARGREERNAKIENAAQAVRLAQQGEEKYQNWKAHRNDLFFKLKDLLKLATTPEPLEDFGLSTAEVMSHVKEAEKIVLRSVGSEKTRPQIDAAIQKLINDAKTFRVLE